jgi:hypothetical protein
MSCINAAAHITSLIEHLIADSQANQPIFSAPFGYEQHVAFGVVSGILGCIFHIPYPIKRLFQLRPFFVIVNVHIQLTSFPI